MAVTRMEIQELVDALEQHFSNERTFAPVGASLMFPAISAVKYHLQTMPKSAFSKGTRPALVQAVIHLATLAKPLAEDDMDIDTALSFLDIE